MYLLKMCLICKNQLLVQKNTLKNTDTKQKVFVYSSYRVFYKVTLLTLQRSSGTPWNLLGLITSLDPQENYI